MNKQGTILQENTLLNQNSVCIIPPPTPRLKRMALPPRVITLIVLPQSIARANSENAKAVAMIMAKSESCICRS